MPDLLSSEKMAEFKEWGDDFLKEILEVYVSSTGQHMQDARQAFAAADEQALHHHLHTIKGATANIGFTEAYELILPLEKACRDGDTSSFPEVATQFEALIQRIADWRASMT